MELTADVVVIGGGFAGLSAAVRLADAGRRVVVVEAAPRLGGRASTFADRTTGERVDNGQHVLFGCYRDTYAFLRCLGTAQLVPLDRTLAVSMAGPDARVRRLKCPSLRPPWHLLAGVLAWSGLPIRDRISVLALVPALRQFTRTHQASGTVAEWLRAHGQSEGLCRWLWNPLAVAALNQQPNEAAAAPFLRVMEELFGPRVEDSAIGLPAVPLDELYAVPAARDLEARGGRVLTGAAARIWLDDSGRLSGVQAGDALVTTRLVVSAVPWHAVQGLWAAGVPEVLSGLCAAASRMESSPIVTVNVWFDRAVLPDRFVGLIGGAMHWAFDTHALVGGGSRRVSVVSSGASDLTSMANDRIVAVALAELGRALPAVREARLERSLVVRERRATFSLAPGQPARPGPVTPLPGFILAGDWTDTGLPATIESAVRSGHRAADEIVR